MPPSCSNIVADYAKSKRSTCKGCNKPIAEKELRLGLKSRDPRGFESTKWHHMGCFSGDFDSAESIKGFDTLKGADQESLKKLLEDVERKEKTKVRQRSEDVESKTQETHTKKQKLSITSEAKVEVELSTSDIKDKYKDATLLPKWKAFQTIIFLEKDDGLRDSSRIAAFDFDGCLVNTAVNRIGADAWSLMYRSVPDKLQELHNDGYKLVIFTNESNIERWKNKRQVAVDSKIGRLNNFIMRVNVPIQVFIACGFDKSGTADAFRKPKPGMWHIMEKHFNSGIKIDMDQSFYVGDAAGRQSDHSEADIKFAEAVGLKFYVPEDYFDA